jgi:hypothetical protein
LRPSLGRVPLCFIVDLGNGLLLDDLDQGRSRLLFKLRIDRSEHRVTAHDNFVGCQRHQRAARHGVMGTKTFTCPLTVLARDGFRLGHILR